MPKRAASCPGDGPRRHRTTAAYSWNGAEVKVDPIELELMRNLFEAAAEEMGITLQRVAFSANIKERRDFSCALFDATGELLGQAAHIPVYLGSMPASGEAVLVWRGKTTAGDGAVGDR